MSHSIKLRTRAETRFTSLLPSHEAVTLFQFLMITLYLLKCTAATYAIRQWRPCFSLCALWTSNVPLLVLRWEPIILPFVRTKSCEQALSGSLSTCFWLSMALSFWPHLAFFWLSFSLAHSGSIHGSLPPSLSLWISRPLLRLLCSSALSTSAPLYPSPPCPHPPAPYGHIGDWLLKLVLTIFEGCLPLTCFPSCFLEKYQTAARIILTRGEGTWTKVREQNIKAKN